MQNRFDTLQQQLDYTHLPLIVLDMQQEAHRILVRRDMHVKDLREQIVNRFVEGATNKAEYVLALDENPLPLVQPVDLIPPLSTLTLRRMQRQHDTQHDLILVFDRTNQFMVDKLPAVIGRSKRDDAVDVNLNDFPESATVSRRHAQLLVQNGVYYIQNISEADRALSVNESPVSSQMMKELTDGSRVRLGKIEFTLRIRPKS